MATPAPADPLMDQTIELVRHERRTGPDGHPVRDARGNDIYDEVGTEVPGCWAQPDGSTEDNAAQQRVEDRMILFGPVGLREQARPTDRVRLPWLGEQLYDITTAIQVWRDPVLGHAWCRLARTSG